MSHQWCELNDEVTFTSVFRVPSITHQNSRRKQLSKKSCWLGNKSYDAKTMPVLHFEKKWRRSRHLLRFLSCHLMARLAQANVCIASLSSQTQVSAMKERAEQQKIAREAEVRRTQEISAKVTEQQQQLQQELREALKQTHSLKMQHSKSVCRCAGTHIPIASTMVLTLSSSQDQEMQLRLQHENMQVETFERRSQQLAAELADQTQNSAVNHVHASSSRNYG